MMGTWSPRRNPCPSSIPGVRPIAAGDQTPHCSRVIRTHRPGPLPPRPATSRPIPRPPQCPGPPSGSSVPTGTVLAILVAAAIPYLMVVRHELAADSASPIWLLPVVAPMVAAALGAALVPHLPHGEWQSTMILGCYALFGMSLLMTLTILPGIWNRLVRFGALPLALTPTLFLILGPLGQSVTAVGHIAEFGAPVVRAPSGDAMDGPREPCR
jgi:hypothetical protein